MPLYHVFANAADYGILEAETAQDAIDEACRIAGYESEAALMEELGQPSEHEAEEVCGIPVQYSNSDETPLTYQAFEQFSSTGNAFPTSRVLEGSDDHGYAEEWAEPGTVNIDGEPRAAKLIYLFSADDLREEAEDYPWDAKHAARILLAD